jgi:hypothetical protein
VRTPLQSNIVESAKQIQQDLQQIGELSIATTSLWEIKNWTGVVVDTFVNFLTLPDAGEARSMDEGVKIVPGCEWTGPVSRVKEHEEMFEVGDERVENLRNESMNGAYLVSCSSALGLGEMANIY